MSKQARTSKVVWKDIALCEGDFIGVHLLGGNSLIGFLTKLNRSVLEISDKWGTVEVDKSIIQRVLKVVH